MCVLNVMTMYSAVVGIFCGLTDILDISIHRGTPLVWLKIKINQYMVQGFFFKLSNINAVSADL